ncbi:MAG: ACT domain-containing protein [Proteobacteria bacterium]|nr:ACT domain-containing protein [Pseudomonadota bacterium]MBU1740322.1 ACT domain-containing protein [Pseudomonadota bacterium]
MQTKTQLSTYVQDAPGVLSGLCSLLAENGVNIEAMSIQNSKDAVKKIFEAREKTGRRIAPAQNYASIMSDAADYSTIRLIVDQPDKAARILAEADYAFDSETVLVVALEDKPGVMGRIAERLAAAGVNINYIYGSVPANGGTSLFVFHVPEAAAAGKLLNQ